LKYLKLKTTYASQYIDIYEKISPFLINQFYGDLEIVKSEDVCAINLLLGGYYSTPSKDNSFTFMNHKDEENYIETKNTDSYIDFYFGLKFTYIENKNLKFSMMIESKPVYIFYTNESYYIFNKRNLAGIYLDVDYKLSDSLGIRLEYFGLNDNRNEPEIKDNNELSIVGYKDYSETFRFELGLTLLGNEVIFKEEDKTSTTKNTSMNLSGAVMLKF
jgi:hypothetical protein